MAFEFEEESPPRSVEELGILVIDGSGSMGLPEPPAQPKALEVMGHLVDSPDSLFERLNKGTRRHEIYLAMITYDHVVTRRLDPTPLTEIDPDKLRVDLLREHGGRTAIGKALNEAGAIARQFLAAQDPSGAPRFVTILLMSDGQEVENSDPVGEALKIKSDAQPKKIGALMSERPDIVIAAAAYGDDADPDTLRSVSTQLPNQPDRFFKRVTTGQQLRDFFIASMTAGPGAAA